MSETLALADDTDPAEPARILRAVAAPPPSPAPRLELPGYDLAIARTLSRELGIGHVLAQVLVRRGLGEADAARAFLRPQEIHDPGCFEGIDAVLETIRSHIESGSRIVVHGDYDVDGICATAIMLRALRSLGADPGWFLPVRERDGYGLARATVQRLAARGTGLLITVDCGITAVEEVDAALAAGLDVVVTDHHRARADGLLPSCGIVHPSVCEYPFEELCGSAVAHKLAEALGAPSASADLELVALATVADLVPLRGENRRIVSDGLAALAITGKPGLRALMEVSRTDPSGIDAGAIGFRLAPRINAAGRMRSPEAGLELLLTGDRERARAIAAELDAVNAERRAVEASIGWQADALVAELGERPMYVLDSAGWHPGVIGIVASRVTERYHRPAILIARDEADPARPASGSGRSIAGFDLLGALQAGAEHLIRYGGHRAAAGLTIAPDRIAAFRACVEAHAAAVLTPDLLAPVERVDAVASGAELGLRTADELARLEPCGLGNPRARLLIPGARLQDVRMMGEGRHARFSVISGGARAQAVAFGCGGRPAAGVEGPLDATFRLERNVWNGAVEPRLVLSRVRACAPRPIEVLGEPARYLPAVLAEAARDPDGGLAPGAPAARRADPNPADARDDGARDVLDRRGEGPLSVLADACAAGATLAVCAEVAPRLPGLAQRTGGFALVAGDALQAAPGLAGAYEHIVLLDPPASAELAGICRAGRGFTHLAYGEAELSFAEKVHEREFSLRASLVALYRALRLQRRCAGVEMERLLRGEAARGRSARLAGRLLRVLGELELVRLDADAWVLELTGAPNAQRRDLAESAAYRAYERIYEDGRRFLSSARAPRPA